MLTAFIHRCFRCLVCGMYIHTGTDSCKRFGARCFMSTDAMSLSLGTWPRRLRVCDDNHLPVQDQRSIGELAWRVSNLFLRSGSAEEESRSASHSSRPNNRSFAAGEIQVPSRVQSVTVQRPTGGYAPLGFLRRSEVNMKAGLLDCLWVCPQFIGSACQFAIFDFHGRCCRPLCCCHFPRESRFLETWIPAY